VRRSVTEIRSRAKSGRRKKALDLQCSDCRSVLQVVSRDDMPEMSQQRCRCHSRRLRGGGNLRRLPKHTGVKFLNTLQSWSEWASDLTLMPVPFYAFKVNWTGKNKMRHSESDESMARDLIMLGAMALPNPSWFIAALHVQPRPVLCRMRGFVAQVASHPLSLVEMARLTILVSVYTVFHKKRPPFLSFIIHSNENQFTWNF